MAYLSSFSLFIYSLSRSLLQIMLMNVPGQPGSAKSSPMQQQQLRGGAYGNDTILLKKNNINIHLIKPIFMYVYISTNKVLFRQKRQGICVTVAKHKNERNIN